VKPVSDDDTPVLMSETFKFCEPEILDGQTITVTGTDGRTVAITCRHLTEAQNSKLVQTVDKWGYEEKSDKTSKPDSDWK
jgi:hypothetical protein